MHLFKNLNFRFQIYLALSVVSSLVCLDLAVVSSFIGAILKLLLAAKMHCGTSVSIFSGSVLTVGEYLF